MTTLTTQLSVVVSLYYEHAVKAAETEAAHKKARAKRFLVAMHDGEAKSAVMAENIAEADDAVADLYSKRLIAAAIADSTRQKIQSLRSEIDWARTQMANQRMADQMHATDRSVT